MHHSRQYQRNSTSWTCDWINGQDSHQNGPTQELLAPNISDGDEKHGLLLRPRALTKPALPSFKAEALHTPTVSKNRAAWAFSASSSHTPRPGRVGVARRWESRGQEWPGRMHPVRTSTALPAPAFSVPEQSKGNRKVTQGGE